MTKGTEYIVELTKNNYEKNASNHSLSLNIFQDLKERAIQYKKATIKDAQLAKMENSINRFLVSENDAVLIQKDYIAEQIANKYTAKLEKINWDSQEVDIQNEGKLSQIGKIRTSATQAKNEIEKITKKIEKIENELTIYLERNKSLSTEDIKIIEEQIKELDQKYQSVYKKTISEIRNNNYQVHGNTVINSENFLDFRKYANNLIDTYFKIEAYAAIEGDLFEYTVAAALNTSKGISEEALKTSLESVKGAEFINTFSPNSSNTKKTFENESVSGQVKSDNLRKKVDVEITLKDNQILRLSAKNISQEDASHKYISVVSGSPLSTMISNIANNNFLYHYFNLYSYHLGQTKKGEEKFEKINNENKNEIGNNMKLALFYVGLTGDRGGTHSDIANAFVVNNKKNPGKVKLVSMPYILEKIQPKFTSIYYNIKGSDTELKSCTLMPYRRTNPLSLILNLHEIKVNAAFNIAPILNLTK